MNIDSDPYNLEDDDQISIIGLWARINFYCFWIQNVIYVVLFVLWVSEQRGRISNETFSFVGMILAIPYMLTFMYSLSYLAINVSGRRTQMVVIYPALFLISLFAIGALIFAIS